MSDTLFLKPNGVQIRDPAHGGKHLPAEGATVPRNAYWLRRLRDGDVVAAEPAGKTARATKHEDK